MADNEIMKTALAELRKDMRKRVGKHLLSIEIHQPEDDEADAGAQPNASEEPTAAKKMGVPLI